MSISRNRVLFPTVRTIVQFGFTQTIPNQLPATRYERQFPKAYLEGNKKKAAVDAAAVAIVAALWSPEVRLHVAAAAAAHADRVVSVLMDLLHSHRAGAAAAAA